MYVRTKMGALAGLGCLAVLSLGVLLLAVPVARAQPKGKPADLEKRFDLLLQELEDLRRDLGRDKPDPKAEQQIAKMRADMKKQAAEIEKLQQQLREAISGFQKAQDQLDKLEGRKRSSFGMGWGSWSSSDWRNWQNRMAPGDKRPTPRADTKPADPEQRLEMLLKGIEELRRELRKDKR